jgi:hypothetical protein
MVVFQWNLAKVAVPLVMTSTWVHRGWESLQRSFVEQNVQQKMQVLTKQQTRATAMGGMMARTRRKTIPKKLWSGSFCLIQEIQLQVKCMNTRLEDTSSTGVGARTA